MLKIIKYSLFDLLRSRWLLIYFLFFLAASGLLFSFSGDASKTLVSLLNVEIAIVPLVSLLFGVMYFYNSREFIVLLLSQPLKRMTIFLGMYLGLAFPLSLCFLLGSSIPFLVSGDATTDPLAFIFYLTTGVLLSFIFTALGFLIALKNDNRIKGFGLSILVWLYMLIIFDGIFLYILMAFQDYPLEKVSLILTLLNPVDLSRVLVLLKLEISALLGYSGALFNDFFGTAIGIAMAFLAMLIWIGIPVAAIVRLGNRKNF
jgi:Cu-processing system permease protein